MTASVGVHTFACRYHLKSAGRARTVAELGTDDTWTCAKFFARTGRHNVQLQRFAACVLQRPRASGGASAAGLVVVLANGSAGDMLWMEAEANAVRYVLFCTLARTHVCSASAASIYLMHTVYMSVHVSCGWNGCHSGT